MKLGILFLLSIYILEGHMLPTKNAPTSTNLALEFFQDANEQKQMTGIDLKLHNKFNSFLSEKEKKVLHDIYDLGALYWLKLFGYTMSLDRKPSHIFGLENNFRGGNEPANKPQTSNTQISSLVQQWKTFQISNHANANNNNAIENKTPTTDQSALNTKGVDQTVHSSTNDQSFTTENQLHNESVNDLFLSLKNETSISGLIAKSDIQQANQPFTEMNDSSLKLQTEMPKQIFQPEQVTLELFHEHNNPSSNEGLPAVTDITPDTMSVSLATEFETNNSKFQIAQVESGITPELSSETVFPSASASTETESPFIQNTTCSGQNDTITPELESSFQVISEQIDTTTSVPPESTSILSQNDNMQPEKETMTSSVSSDVPMQESNVIVSELQPTTAFTQQTTFGEFNITAETNEDTTFSNQESTETMPLSDMGRVDPANLHENISQLLINNLQEHQTSDVFGITDSTLSFLSSEPSATTEISDPSVFEQNTSQINAFSLAEQDTQPNVDNFSTASNQQSLTVPEEAQVNQTLDPVSVPNDLIEHFPLSQSSNQLSVFPESILSTPSEAAQGLSEQTFPNSNLTLGQTHFPSLETLSDTSLREGIPAQDINLNITETNNQTVSWILPVQTHEGQTFADQHLTETQTPLDNVLNQQQSQQEISFTAQQETFSSNNAHSPNNENSALPSVNTLFKNSMLGHEGHAFTDQHSMDTQAPLDNVLNQQQSQQEISFTAQQETFSSNNAHSPNNETSALPSVSTLFKNSMQGHEGHAFTNQHSIDTQATLDNVLNQQQSQQEIAFTAPQETFSSNNAHSPNNENSALPSVSTLFKNSMQGHEGHAFTNQHSIDTQATLDNVLNQQQSQQEIAFTAPQETFSSNNAHSPNNENSALPSVNTLFKNSMQGHEGHAFTNQHSIDAQAPLDNVLNQQQSQQEIAFTAPQETFSSNNAHSPNNENSALPSVSTLFKNSMQGHEGHAFTNQHSIDTQATLDNVLNQQQSQQEIAFTAPQETFSSNNAHSPNNENSALPSVNTLFKNSMQGHEGHAFTNQHSIDTQAPLGNVLNQQQSQQEIAFTAPQETFLSNTAQLPDKENLALPAVNPLFKKLHY